MEEQDVKITKKDERNLAEEVKRLLEKEDYPLQERIELRGINLWIDLRERYRKNEELQDAVLKAIEKTYLETFGNLEPEELREKIEKENFLDEKNKGFWEFYVKIVDEIRPLVEKEAKEITGFLGQGALQDLFNRIDEVKHFFFRTLNVATDLREDGKLQKADDEIVETGLRVGVYLFIQNNFFKLIAEQIKSFFHDATLE